MSENTEPIEQYLQGIAVPHCISDTHRRQLRGRVLAELQKRQTTIPLPGVSWKLAVAAVVCVAGAVGAIMQANHHAASSRPGSAYQLISESPSLPNAKDTTEAVQTGKDLEGIDLLCPQDNLKLIRVVDSEVNGRLDSRMLLCKYALPNGRTKAAADPNQAMENPLASLPAATRAEISQLRRAGQGENLGTQVREVKGRRFVFQRERFTLHNGTKVVLSVGEPQETGAAHP